MLRRVKWEKALSGVVCGTVGRAADVWGQTWISHNMQPTYYAACTACRTSQWTAQHTVMSDTDSDSLENSTIWQIHMCVRYSNTTAADGSTGTCYSSTVDTNMYCMYNHRQKRCSQEGWVHQTSPSAPSLGQICSSTFTWLVANSLRPEWARCAQLSFSPVPKWTWHSRVHWGSSDNINAYPLNDSERPVWTASRHKTKS